MTDTPNPRIQPWLEAQLRLAEAERTGRGVVVFTADAVYGPAIVEAERRNMTTLRTGREVVTLRLLDIDAVEWAPERRPERAP